MRKLARIEELEEKVARLEWICGRLTQAIADMGDEKTKNEILDKFDPWDVLLTKVLAEVSAELCHGKD